MDREMLRKIQQLLEGWMQGRAPVNIMEVCGTHTTVIGKSGIRSLLPENLQLISGPGCPVCVTHDEDIANYLYLAKKEKVLLATFGDLLRIPGKEGSLDQARSEGAAVEIVSSVTDALQLARKNPKREVVFLGIGFETTAPTSAAALLQAQREELKNFSIYSMHKLVPPVMAALLAASDIEIDGFLCPGHVSTIIGTAPYGFIPESYEKACVIGGFAPQDILLSLVMLAKQIVEKRFTVELQYRMGVHEEGNPTARKLMETVFAPQGSLWRGFGYVEASGFGIREAYICYDAQKRFDLPSIKEERKEKRSPCLCGEILKGIKRPGDCSLFGQGCTPRHPVGPCMVSSEGACSAYYYYEYKEG